MRRSILPSSERSSGALPEWLSEPTRSWLSDETVAQLRTADDLEAVQRIVRTEARTLARADGATFVLREGDNCYYADEDAMSPLWKGQRFPLTNCISGWAMLKAQIVVIPDIEEDDRIPIEAYRPTFVRSMAMVPVGAGEPVAAIGLYWSTHHRAAADEIVAVSELAREVSAALERIGLDMTSVHAGSGATSDLQPVTRSFEDDAARRLREQIARDLHDVVLQRLFAAGLGLQRNLLREHDAESTSELHGSLEQIDDAIRELRGVIYGLEYGSDRLSGLEGRILTLVAEASRTLGFRPDLSFNGSLESVSDQVRTEAVCVLRELLSNVARHAGATSVRIAVSGGTSLEVRVVDNGCGVTASPSPGSGLRNLEARARSLGGTFTMERTESNETVATWTAPLVPMEGSSGD